jgi:osmotically-inducible protein OsmY
MPAGIIGSRPPLVARAAALAVGLLLPVAPGLVAGQEGGLSGAEGTPPGQWEENPIGAAAEAGPKGPEYSEDQSPDARLANRIAERLSWDRELARFDFDVRVEQGVVTITGQVANPAQAHRARRIADTMPGVVGVVNAVRSAPKLAMEGLGELPPVDDETLRERVMATLQDHPRIQATRVEVAVEDGRVILEGEIPGLNQRARAERLVLGLHGVDRVDNRLRATEEFGTGG